MSERHPASFRDPSGFVFRDSDGVLLRQVESFYADSYDRLMASGLYDALVGEGLLVRHSEVDVARGAAARAHRVLEPEPISFVSYPYEWCFGQLKAAALATLAVQRTALAHEMSLKDASAYNIQFRGSKPVFIDTLSFEPFVEGSPWVAYRQFCQHFLAPLALMAYRDVRLAQLLRSHIDGVPLDLAASLLPRRTRLRFSLSTHIHLHARFQQSHSAGGEASAHKARQASISRQGLEGILESLRAAVEGLAWETPKTEWGDYYEATNYSDAAFEQKRKLVSGMLDAIGPATVFDLGANTGEFSRIASARGIPTVAFDVDPVAVERNYQACLRDDDEMLLPLWLDLTNPSPGLGWAHEERASLAERGPADCVLALALVHHLAISNNVPLAHVARYFAQLGRQLIIEFVPKSDSQVRRLLATREDVFPGYTQEGFEVAFGGHFEICSAQPVSGSERVLYHMRARPVGSQAPS